jgi:hypothetical protein
LVAGSAPGFFVCVVVWSCSSRSDRPACSRLRTYTAVPGDAEPGMQVAAARLLRPALEAAAGGRRADTLPSAKRFCKAGAAAPRAPMRLVPSTVRRAGQQRLDAAWTDQCAPAQGTRAHQGDQLFADAAIPDPSAF